MYPTINIGSFALPTAGLLYIFGAYFCLDLLERTAVRVKHDPTQMYALGTTTLVAGIVGARLVFVIEYWAAFRENLLSIVWPLNSGYNSWAGLLIGLTAGFFYARARQLPPAKTLDALVPGVLAGFAIISLKDFLVGPGYGTASTLPWALSQFGISRHPVQIYELLLAVVAFYSWWRMTRRSVQSGFPVLVVTAVYSAGRLYLDAFRENAWLTANGLHVWQLVSFVALIAALFFLRPYLLPTPKKDPPQYS